MKSHSSQVLTPFIVGHVMNGNYHTTIPIYYLHSGFQQLSCVINYPVVKREKGSELYVAIFPKGTAGSQLELQSESSGHMFCFINADVSSCFFSGYEPVSRFQQLQFGIYYIKMNEMIVPRITIIHNSVSQMVTISCYLSQLSSFLAVYNDNDSR